MCRHLSEIVIPLYKPQRKWILIAEKLRTGTSPGGIVRLSTLLVEKKAEVSFTNTFLSTTAFSLLLMTLPSAMSASRLLSATNIAHPNTHRVQLTHKRPAMLRQVLTYLPLS